MQHGQRAIERIEPGPELAEALQCWHRDYALEGLARISHARAGTILEGTDPAALARTLYEDHLRARMAAL